MDMSIYACLDGKITHFCAVLFQYMAPVYFYLPQMQHGLNKIALHP
jgi:hypothetical protein